MTRKFKIKMLTAEVFGLSTDRLRSVMVLARSLSRDGDVMEATVPEQKGLELMDALSRYGVTYLVEELRA